MFQEIKNIEDPPEPTQIPQNATRKSFVPAKRKERQSLPPIHIPKKSRVGPTLELNDSNIPYET